MYTCIYLSLFANVGRTYKIQNERQSGTLEKSFRDNSDTTEYTCVLTFLQEFTALKKKNVSISYTTNEEILRNGFLAERHAKSGQNAIFLYVVTESGSMFPSGCILNDTEYC